MEIITPQRLYHGTLDIYWPSFRQRLLDASYWKPGRDFGEGFYTTISPAQARKWAVKAAQRAVGDVKPCVLEVELLAVPPAYEPLIFLGESLQWASFILEHRKVDRKGDPDPCKVHPDIIVGPMADGDTGKILAECVQWNKDVRWFYDRITRSARGRRLDSLRLGNQVVFSSEKWESSLRLTGCYIQTGGRWIYHANAGAVERL